MGDYFNYSRRGNAPVTQDRLNAPLPPPGQRTPGPQTPGVPQTPGGRQWGGQGPLESLRPASSIRIRRLPSQLTTTRTNSRQAREPSPQPDTGVPGRRRSASDPHRYGANLAPPGMDLSRQRTQEMATVREEAPGGYYAPSESTLSFHEAQETPRPGTPSINIEGTSPTERVITGASTLQDAGNAARANRGLHRFRTAGSAMPRDAPAEDEYNSDVVDLLDLVDPEVRTIGTLNNIQNSLFIPDLGGLINRRPTYNLTARPSSYAQSSGVQRVPSRRAAAARTPGLPTIPSRPQTEVEGEPGGIELRAPQGRRFSISSNLSDSRYAVLPHGISLEDWTEEDKEDLDDHVRHLMHSKREGFKRSMRGFGQYISKPLGLFVFLYATLVTLFGAAWVFFLIGWIYVGPKQSYIINIVDLTLVALFALMGDGLAPFRAVDTYHMICIARYHYMTWRLRKEKALPALVDHNDLPDRRASSGDVEALADKEEAAEFSVLKPIQQKRLQYHQAKFSKAHTFYRPHETATHHAFPIRLMITAVVLLDCHSLFQVALGTCTWSWNYHTRPSALTATILSCSITCNIAAGIVISIGDKRTRKKDVLERMKRQELTEEALGRMAEERNQDPQIIKKSYEANLVSKQREREEAGRKSMEVNRAARGEETARIREEQRQAGASVQDLTKSKESR